MRATFCFLGDLAVILFAESTTRSLNGGDFLLGSHFPSPREMVSLDLR